MQIWEWVPPQKRALNISACLVIERETADCEYWKPGEGMEVGQPKKLPDGRWGTFLYTAQNDETSLYKSLFFQNSHLF